jgi:hypothetical protein
MSCHVVSKTKPRNSRLPGEMSLTLADLSSFHPICIRLPPLFKCIVTVVAINLFLKTTLARSNTAEEASKPTFHISHYRSEINSHKRFFIRPRWRIDPRQAAPVLIRQWECPTLDWT